MKGKKDLRRRRFHASEKDEVWQPRAIKQRMKEGRSDGASAFLILRLPCNDRSLTTSETAWCSNYATPITSDDDDDSDDLSVGSSSSET